ncbi:MAG: glycosyltransferase family 39 protein, partial [Nitrospinales bacterium]
MLGMYLIGRRLHSRQAGYWAAILYLICPYDFFYDRMVHESSLINCFFIWILWLTLALVDKDRPPRTFHYALLTEVVGFGLLTMATAALFVFLPFVFYFVFWKAAPRGQLKPLSVSYLVGILMAVFPYAALYLFSKNYKVGGFFIPSSHYLRDKSLLDMLQGVPMEAYGNAGTLLDYFIHYLTWPLLASGVLFLFLQFIKFNRKYFILLVYFFVPTILLLGTAGAGFPRYYVFCATPLLLWAAMFFCDAGDFLRKKFFGKTPVLIVWAPLLLLFLPAASFDFKLLTSPEDAPFPESDRLQYVQSQHSGYGIPEALNFFREAAKEKRITVLTTSNWGNPADAIHLYLEGHPNIDVHMAYWVFKRPLLTPDIEGIIFYEKFTKKIMKEVSPQTFADDVYFIMRTTPGLPRKVFLNANPNFELVQVFKKPNSSKFVEIYKLVWKRN